ncbi:MAG: sulfatase-like hydrolase/transferase [Acidobacteriota bacterium]|nr:sulfatase-like hydrolase/transferase [Acidobacteriota bacterium]
MLALAAAAWWALQPRAFSLEHTADRNVLIVTIDTLRADALGSYGGNAATPNLDRLAAGGARFDFAHAHAVVTLPSHASIMSGRYPYQHAVRDNTGYRFDAATPTIASLLKAQGFATGAFIGGFPLDRRFGLGAGFDTYDDRLDPASAADAGERERRADAVIASATAWMGAQQGKWLAWVHLYDPHVTYAPPAEWAARYPASPYLGEVSWTDHALGALLTRLGSQARNTLIIVTADHGESLGDHGELTHGLFAYEATLRVPLIVAETGSRVARADGVTVTSPVRHVDLLPTVLDAIGAPALADLPGSSLAPVIASGGGDDRPSYFEAMSSAVTRGWAPLRGVVAGREKYIDLPIPELYDLAADPAEARNLASQGSRPQVLFNMLKGFSVAPPARAQAETPETLERLRSLGYIGGGVAAVRDAYTEADDPKRLIEIEQLLQRAGEAHRSGRMDDAGAMYRTVIARRPDTEDAYRKLALVHWQQGRPAEAIATLESALAAGVTQSEVRIKLGQYLAEAGRPGRAIELLEHTAGTDPDALIALGNAYMLGNREREAIATFGRVLAVDPVNALAHENIGAAHLRTGRLAAAEQSLRRALEIDASLTGAHTALGVVFASTRRQDDAIRAWQRAVALDPRELNALYNLTVNLVQAGRRDEARAYGERFLTFAPPHLREDAAAIRKLLGT